MRVNPIELYGPWDEGYALDIHTISSEFIGYDVYGHPEFDNQYSDMGGLLNSFKYKFHYDKLNDIVRLAEPFIRSWEALKNVSSVLPVPSSKGRGIIILYKK